MDPNENLAEQRLLIERVRFGLGRYSGHFDDFVSDAARLAELVLALDEWIKRGGFLPTTWDYQRR